MQGTAEARLPSKEPQRAAVDPRARGLERLQRRMRLARVGGPHVRDHPAPHHARRRIP